MINNETRAWIEQTVKDKQTDSIFHDYLGIDAPPLIIKSGNRAVYVCATGEIDYRTEEVRYRCSGDFLSSGIDTDDKLLALDEDGWVHNNWFEVMPMMNNEIIDCWTDVCHSTTELEEMITQILTNDEWWKEIAA